MIIDFVTLEEVKAHLYLSEADTTHDVDLNNKIEIVSDTIMEYLKLTSPPESWGDTTSPSITVVPARYKGCALLMIGELYENREATAADVLSDAIKKILKRPPTFA